jgi:glycosyltransferase involved in cell wall biosynthesis
MFKSNKNCEKQCFSCHLYSLPKKYASQLVDEVVGVSQFILDKHVDYNYFLNANKRVIYNSIDIPKNILNQNIKKKEDIVFGYVGNLSQSKGIEFLLEKFDQLKIENIQLYIYGKGTTKQYAHSLQQRYKNNKVVFKGYEATDTIYTNIDILIVPSLWNEPFGRIVPEANSYNIPVLTTDKGGLSELVKNGRNGYIFNPNIENDFFRKLELILSMYKEKFFKFDLSSFSSDSIIEQYREVYGS